MASRFSSDFVEVSEEMVRKRSEHNELIISTLEEISLHQQDIERIEYLDKWCRELKILYLQSNLIPKIENVSRLKKLEYLNLALNNVELIENLEGCESLQKLDLTVNFVGDITSVESLKDLVHLKEMYLTGNPCSEFEGYRDYVIATLPQLQTLDGTEVEKSERILAIQALPGIKKKITEQVHQYKRKREKQKEEARSEEEKKKNKSEQKPGFDGRWYTDINDTDKSQDKGKDNGESKGENEEEEDDTEFWEEKVAFTPESRLQVHEHMKKKREREDQKNNKEKPKRERKLQTDDGRILNVNEAKINFTLTESADGQSLLLDIPVWKHMDSSLVDADVQTTHIKVTLKGKVLQLVLPEEVKPDSSTAQRSQITGNLLITMPKENPPPVPTKPQEKIKEEQESEPSETSHEKKPERLEVDPSLQKGVDLGFVKDPEDIAPPLGSTQYRSKKNIPERENSPDFVDDPDVPPLM